MPLTSPSVSVDNGSMKIGSFCTLIVTPNIANGATFTTDGTANYKTVNSTAVPTGQIWRNVCGETTGPAITVGCLCQRIG